MKRQFDKPSAILEGMREKMPPPPPVTHWLSNLASSPATLLPSGVVNDLPVTHRLEFCLCLCIHGECHPTAVRVILDQPEGNAASFCPEALCSSAPDISALFRGKQEDPHQRLLSTVAVIWTSGFTAYEAIQQKHCSLWSKKKKKKRALFKALVLIFATLAQETALSSLFTRFYLIHSYDNCESMLQEFWAESSEWRVILGLSCQLLWDVLEPSFSSAALEKEPAVWLFLPLLTCSRMWGLLPPSPKCNTHLGSIDRIKMLKQHGRKRRSVSTVFIYCPKALESDNP